MRLARIECHDPMAILQDSGDGASASREVSYLCIDEMLRELPIGIQQQSVFSHRADLRHQMLDALLERHVIVVHEVDVELGPQLAANRALPRLWVFAPLLHDNGDHLLHAFAAQRIIELIFAAWAYRLAHEEAHPCKQRLLGAGTAVRGITEMGIVMAFEGRLSGVPIKEERGGRTSCRWRHLRRYHWPFPCSAS